jgi:hypothetical protein
VIKLYQCNPKNIKGVHITLNSRDEYDVEFWKMKKWTDKPNITKVTCQAENLRKIFEEHTGLYTSLSTIASKTELTPELRRRVESSVADYEHNITKFHELLKTGDPTKKQEYEALLSDYTKQTIKLKKALEDGYLEISAEADDTNLASHADDLIKHHTDLAMEHTEKSDKFSKSAELSSGRKKYVLGRLADHHAGEAVHHKAKAREASWIKDLGDEFDTPAPKGKELPMPEPKGKEKIEPKVSNPKTIPSKHNPRPTFKRSAHVIKPVPKGKHTARVITIAAELPKDKTKKADPPPEAKPAAKRPELAPDDDQAAPVHGKHKRKAHVKGSPTDINYFLQHGLGYDSADEIKQWQWFKEGNILFYHDPNLDVDEEGDDNTPTTTNWWNRLTNDDLTASKWQITLDGLVAFLTKMGMKPVDKKAENFKYDPIKNSGDTVSRSELNPFRG